MKVELDFMFGNPLYGECKYQRIDEEDRDDIVLAGSYSEAVKLVRKNLATMIRKEKSFRKAVIIGPPNIPRKLDPRDYRFGKSNSRAIAGGIMRKFSSVDRGNRPFFPFPYLVVLDVLSRHFDEVWYKGECGMIQVYISPQALVIN